jgi:competence protein ComGF
VAIVSIVVLAIIALVVILFLFLGQGEDNSETIDERTTV